MSYSDLQTRIYENKVRRGFNVTDIGKELILMLEELGELNAGYLCLKKSNDHGTHLKAYQEMVDAIGDLQVYNLGLVAMFSWKADTLINKEVELPTQEYSSHIVRNDSSSFRPRREIIETPLPISLENYFPFVARELGLLAKIYKKSNKEPVGMIDHREEFKTTLGNLLGYCSKMFQIVNANEFSVLEEIVRNNETRTHEGKI